MAHLSAKAATPVYAVYSKDSPRVIYVDSPKEAVKHLGTPEFRDGRFQKHPNLEAAEKYLATNPAPATPTRITTKTDDGYRSPHAPLKAPELSKFKRFIEGGNNVEAVEHMDKNPHYFIDMSLDKPSCLHHGASYNALHICARTNNLFIAMEIMRRIKDLQYISNIYKTEANVEETSAALIDRFLNTPDKAGIYPLMWAARYGHIKLVMFLSSFPEAKLPDIKHVNEIGCQKDSGKHTSNCLNIFNCLQHPSQLYYITLFKEENDADMPFISITSRFPYASISASQKQRYFQMIHSSVFVGHSRDTISTIRVSKDAKGVNVADIPPIDAVHSLFVPYAAVGVFWDKEAAIACYKTILAECKTSQDPLFLCDHLSDFALELAETQQFFVFLPDSSGMIIPNEKRKDFTDKLQPKDDDNLISNALEKLNMSAPSDDRKEYDSDDDNEYFYTAPSSPIRSVSFN